MIRGIGNEAMMMVRLLDTRELLHQLGEVDEAYTDLLEASYKGQSISDIALYNLGFLTAAICDELDRRDRLYTGRDFGQWSGREEE